MIRPEGELLLKSDAVSIVFQQPVFLTAQASQVVLQQRMYLERRPQWALRQIYLLQRNSHFQSLKFA